MKIKNLDYLVQISIFSAIATVLTFIKIPVFFVPAFYKLDFSDTIILISSFSLGTLAGFLTLTVKTLLSLIIKGTSSFGVGQLADFIACIALILPSSLIYKRHKTFKGAQISILIGILCLTIISALANYFVIVPIDQKLFSISDYNLIAISHSFNPFVTDKLSFILFIVCPFNFLKGLAVGVFSLTIYKKLIKSLNKI